MLSCRDAEVAARSLGELLDVTPSELGAVLQGLTPHQREWEWEATPWAAVEARLGVSPPEPPWQFVFFHAARTLAPVSYRERGLLPLDQALPLVLADLRGLLPAVTDAEWSHFAEEIDGGRAIAAIRQRLDNCQQRGPFGYVVREIAVDPPDSDWPYTQCPETVSDLIDHSPQGWNLRARYENSAVPTIVHFAGLVTDVGYLASLAEYIWCRLHQEPVIDLTDAFWTCGTPVPPADILEVELLAIAQKAEDG